MKFIDFYEQNKSEIEALLIDIDGTLSVGTRPIGDAAKFIEILRNDRKPFFLLTNDGNHSIREKWEFLRSAEIELDEQDIISCADALKILTKDDAYQDKKFFVIGELGNPCYAEKANIKVTRDLDEIFECDGCIGGEGFFDWKKTLETVLNFFMTFPDKPYIVPNPDGIWPKSPNSFRIGAGGIARLISNLLNDHNIPFEITYLGKPYRGIYDYTFEKLADKLNKKVENLNFQKIYAIGDSLSSDIAGANNAKIVSSLVLTGITNQTILDNEKNENKKPKLIFDAIA